MSKHNQALFDTYIDTLMETGKRAAEQSGSPDISGLTHAYVAGALRGMINCLMYLPEVQQSVAFQTEFHRNQHTGN